MAAAAGTVVATQSSPALRRWGRRGGGSCGAHKAIDPMCMPRRLEVLCVLLTKTHPITPDTLGARVVAVLGPLVRWLPSGK